MVLSSGDISSLIFTRLVRKDLGNFSLNRKTLVVLMELDGKATLKEIADKSGLKMGTVRELISNLLRLGLIEKVDKKFTPMDTDCFHFLLDELVLAVGPVAGILVEDEIRSFGYDVTDFPSHLVWKLVDNLSGEISRQEKKSLFIMNMGNKIREKGYADS